MDQASRGIPHAGPVTRLRATELAARIEEDINTGVLVMGTWLKQVDLEAHYNGTRIDLRQALDRLVEKGLVGHVANRGYRVQEISAERMAEIRVVRAILEVAAAELVMAAIDEAGLDALHEAAVWFEESVLHGTVVAQEAANSLFHTRMLDYCSNRELVGLIFDLRRRIPLAATRQHNTGILLRRAAQDHFDMVALLRSRDLPALSVLMRQHVIANLVAAPRSPAP